MDLRTFRRNGPGLAECESQAAWCRLWADRRPHWSLDTRGPVSTVAASWPQFGYRGMARDDARFTAVRALTSSRSYSASEPRTPIIMRPAAVGGAHPGEPLVGCGHRHPARSRCRREEMKMLAVIDHSGGATNEGLALRVTKLVIFGSPTAGPR